MRRRIEDLAAPDMSRFSWCPGTGTMITDLEIYRAANQLVKRYGQNAEFEAAMRTR